MQGRSTYNEYVHYVPRHITYNKCKTAVCVCFKWGGYADWVNSEQVNQAILSYHTWTLTAVNSIRSQGLLIISPKALKITSQYYVYNSIALFHFYVFYRKLYSFFICGIYIYLYIPEHQGRKVHIQSRGEECFRKKETIYAL